MLPKVEGLRKYHWHPQHPRIFPFCMGNLNRLNYRELS
jgi:hypothetical protein